MNDEANIAEVRLGKAVKDFLASDVGKYMLSRARMEREQARVLLETARLDQVQELQNRAVVARSIEGWLISAVENGDHVEFQMVAMDIS